MAFPTTSLFARYEAKSETGKIDGDLLATIIDQSGSGRDLSQATSSKRPVYKTGIVNGQPVFRFDGTDDIISRSTALAERSNASISAVVSSGAAEATARQWIANFAVATGRVFSIMEGTTSGEWGTFTRTNTSTVQSPTSGVNTLTWCVLTIVWTGTTVTFYRNGTSVASVAQSGLINGADVALGALPAIAADYYGGDIALAGIWEGALDATTRSDLHSYVQDTYGITVSDYSGGPAPVQKMRVGPDLVTAARIGSSTVSKAYVGSTQVLG